MDFLVFLRARAGRPPQGFKDWYVDRFATRAAELCPGLRRHVANLSVQGPPELRSLQDDADPQSRYDVVASFDLEAPPLFSRILQDAELTDWADIRNGYRV